MANVNTSDSAGSVPARQVRLGNKKRPKPVSDPARQVRFGIKKVHLLGQYRCLLKSSLSALHQNKSRASHD